MVAGGYRVWARCVDHFVVNDGCLSARGGSVLKCRGIFNCAGAKSRLRQDDALTVQEVGFLCTGEVGFQVGSTCGLCLACDAVGVYR
jgi:hypothetical protein